MSTELEDHCKRVYVIEKVRKAFHEADVNHDNQICREEFDNLLDGRPDLVDALAKCGIELDDVLEFFEILDVNDTGAIHEADFTGACLRVSREYEATVKDMHITSMSMDLLNQKCQDLEKSMTDCQHEMQAIIFFLDSRYCFMQYCLGVLAFFESHCKKRNRFHRKKKIVFRGFPVFVQPHGLRFLVTGTSDSSWWP